MKRNLIGLIISGVAAGAINGLFGGGGGMVLIPLMGLFTDFRSKTLFSSSVAVILPICVVSLAVSALSSPLPWLESVPWLIGGTVGGYLAAKWGYKIPNRWLHRGLGILIIYGGVKYLC